MTATAEKLAYTIPEVCAVTGMGEKQVRQAINTGQLRSKRAARAKNDPKRGIGKHIILAPELAAWLESLPDG